MDMSRLVESNLWVNVGTLVIAYASIMQIPRAINRLRVNNPSSFKAGEGKLSGRIYALYDERVSWEEAKERCLSLGGNLVCITSQEEQDFIVEMTKNAKTNVWLGAYRSGANVDGQLVTGESFEGGFKPPIYDSNDSRNVGGAAMLVSAYAGKNNSVVGKWWFNDDTHKNYSKLCFICEWVVVNGRKPGPRLFRGITKSL